MKPASFDYFAPRSLHEALRHLGQANGDAAVIAGGQTLVPLMALRMAVPSILVDINHLEELRTIERSAASTRVGAAVRQAEILRDPILARHVPALVAATALVGHHQTRNRGTIGGSIALAEPAAEIPAVALSLGARIQARSTSAERTIEAEDFFVGPYTTALEPNEIITAVEFPDWRPGTRAIVREVARRPGDFALVGLVCIVTVADGRVSRAGIGWFGMGPMPLRSRAAEQALTGQATDAVDAGAIAALAVSETEPVDDGHATAAYRRTVGRTLLERVIGEAFNPETADE